MNEKMLYSDAAILTATGKPLEIIKLKLPALKPGQVKVQMESSGICATQLLEVNGQKGPDRFLPHTLGHEGVGYILEIGPEVKKVKVGDRVALTWLKGSGADIPSTTYQSPIGTVNSGAVSTLLSTAIVSENRVVKINSEIPALEAALLGCALPTGGGVILNSGLVNKDSTIIIFGLGGIGLCTLIVANSIAAAKIICVDPSQAKREIAMGLGAHFVVDPASTDLLEELLKLTNRQGADVCIEASGRISSMEIAVSSARDKGGTAIIIGNAPHGEKMSLDPFLFIRGKRLIGSWGGESNPDLDIPKYLEMYAKKLLPLDKLISPAYKLHEINNAFEDLAQAKVNRAIIDFR